MSTTARVGLLLAGFSVIALVAVTLRIEQTRAAARTVRAEFAQVEARRELWRVQAAVARLKAPDEIRERVTRFDSDLEPPGSSDAACPARSLALGHPDD